MTTEADVAIAALAVRVDDLARRMDGAEGHIEASTTARADTNTRLTALEAGQAHLSAGVDEIKRMISRDVRWALVGGAMTIAVLFLLVVLAVAAGPDAVGDAARMLLVRIFGAPA